MSTAFLRNPLTGLIILASAAGGPYVLYETDAGQTARSSAAQIMEWTSPSGGEVLPSGGNAGSYDSATGQFIDIVGSDPSNNLLNPGTLEHDLSQPVIHSLREVVRFDINPGWVVSRFPRVSTILADTQLDGLRVPLVTGTSPQDLAGTLTYYFDRYQRLQRISIHAASGDATRFIGEMQQLYQLKQEPSLGGGLYTMKWNGRPTSLLHVSPAPVIYGDAAYARYNVFIEFNQAGLEYGLSYEAQQLLNAGRQTQRW